MAENDIADFQADEKTMLEADKGLAKQDLSKLDPASLRPDTFEVMSRQATVNIGTIGHVAHGKSTVVKAMSGVRTTKFKKEAVMNITIHLGYANAKIFKCPKCPEPQCYQAYGSSMADKSPCAICGTELNLVRHVSFVDCPGHDVLMATMLNGAAIMDAALLLIAANETFPQPQTLEHLKAVEIMKLRNIIVLQNKIDLVKNLAAKEQYNSIRSYLTSSLGLSPPILPISAQLKYNIDALLQYICHIPLPQRTITKPSRMIVVRSFDVNKPGDDIDGLRGGVAGGSVVEGILKKDQLVEVRPGLVLPGVGSAPFMCKPFRTRVVSLMAENNQLQYAIPGGLIAVGTNLDPTNTRQNKLVGQLIGEPGSLPEVYAEIEVQFFLLSSLVGAKKAGASKDAAAKAAGGSSGTTTIKIPRLQPDETLQINIGTLTVGSTVLSVTKEPDLAKLSLVQPVCCTVGEQIAISRRVEKHFRLIGWGSIRRGASIELQQS